MGNSIALHCSVCRLLAKIIHQSHKTEMLPFLRLSLAACPSQHHQQHHKTAGCAGADMRAGKRWGRGAGSGSAACWGPDRHLCCEPACRAKQPPGELLSPTRLSTHGCSHGASDVGDIVSKCSLLVSGAGDAAARGRANRSKVLGPKVPGTLVQRALLRSKVLWLHAASCQHVDCMLTPDCGPSGRIRVGLVQCTREWSSVTASGCAGQTSTS